MQKLILKNMQLVLGSKLNTSIAALPVSQNAKQPGGHFRETHGLGFEIQDLGC